MLALAASIYSASPHDTTSSACKCLAPNSSTSLSCCALSVSVYSYIARRGRGIRADSVKIGIFRKTGKLKCIASSTYTTRNLILTAPSAAYSVWRFDILDSAVSHSIFSFSVCAAWISSSALACSASMVCASELGVGFRM